MKMNAFCYSLFLTLLSMVLYCNALQSITEGSLIDTLSARSLMEKRRAARELFGKRTNFAPYFGRQLRRNREFRSRELFGKRSAPPPEPDEEKVTQPSLADSLEVPPSYDQTLSYQMGRPVMLIQVPKEFDQKSLGVEKRRPRELFGKRSAVRRHLTDNDYVEFITSLSDRARRGRVNEFLG